MTADDNNEQRAAEQQEQVRQLSELPDDARHALFEGMNDENAQALLEAFRDHECFTVLEAAMLACGKDPQFFDDPAQILGTEGVKPMEMFKGVRAVYRALIRDIEGRKLNAIPDGEEGTESIARLDFERWRKANTTGTRAMPGSEKDCGTLDSTGGARGDGLKRRERQIQAIEAAARSHGWDPLAIPTQGKKTLSAHCREEHRSLFSSVSMFEDAWKDARAARPERVKMKDHAKFVGEK